MYVQSLVWSSAMGGSKPTNPAILRRPAAPALPGFLTPRARIDRLVSRRAARAVLAARSLALIMSHDAALQKKKKEKRSHNAVPYPASSSDRVSVF
jgi:hypothetical protein